MNVNSLRYYCCPICRTSAFEVKEAPTLEAEACVVTGELVCRGCAATFPIVNGIARFVRDEEYAESFGLQWNKFRKIQLDSYTGLPLSSDRLFRVTKWSRNLGDCLVLEAGSGAGRFTEVLLGTGASVFSFDLSNAVEANAANNREKPNLNVFQASIYDIPMRERAFDKILCLGVLQHTPDPERAFASLVRFLKPGGEIAVDIYARRLRSLISWKYLLRPLTKRMPKELLFRVVEHTVKALLPTTVVLRQLGGRWGARLMPIMDWSNLGLARELNLEWSVLDTFDMYAPTHDHPCSISEVRRWFVEGDLENVVVEYGPNGIIARGRNPLATRTNQ